MTAHGAPRSLTWEYLKWDGGWLTAEGIAMEVGISAANVERSMWRWASKGHVEERHVALAYNGGVNRSGRNRSSIEGRHEWRAT